MELLPHEIAAELDKYIVGQAKAKRVVAVALRNHHRRMKADPAMRAEITPKNVLMVGPTGVGKTEIARRVAKIADVPFIKVEATKFTEVGYVGADVTDMINDLVQEAIRNIERKRLQKQQTTQGKKENWDKVHRSDVTQYRRGVILGLKAVGLPNKDLTKLNKRDLAAKIDKNEIDDRIIETSLGTVGLLDFDDDITDIIAKTLNLKGFNSPEKPKKELPEGVEIENGRASMTVKKFRELFNQEQAKYRFETPTWTPPDTRNPFMAAMYGAATASPDAKKAIEDVENGSIVFLDEIDKIAITDKVAGKSISRIGVQRDLLTLVEGTTVNTKFGPVDTTNILFIGSGAFHEAKVEDLMPELQGRFPVRVELEPLSEEDFVAILSGTKNNIIRQYHALLEVDNVSIELTEDAIHSLASFAYKLNKERNNIGARRLHSVIEKLLEDISYNTYQYVGETITIDRAYVEKQLDEMLKKSVDLGIKDWTKAHDDILDIAKLYAAGKYNKIPEKFFPRIDTYMKATTGVKNQAIRAEWYRTVMFRDMDAKEAAEEAIKEDKQYDEQLEKEKGDKK